MQKRRSRKSNIAAVGDQATLGDVDVTSSDNVASFRGKNNETEGNNIKDKSPGRSQVVEELHNLNIHTRYNVSQPCKILGYRKFSLQSKYLHKSCYPYGIFRLVSDVANF